MEEAIWADVGAGDGAFTLALAELLGPGATIHTIDRDGAALTQGAAEASRRYPGVRLLPSGPLSPRERARERVYLLPSQTLP